MTHHKTSFYIRKVYRCSNHTLPIRCLFGWKEKLFPSTKTDIVYLVQTDNIIGVIKLRAFLKVNYRFLPFKVDNDLIQRNINLFDIWTCRDFLIFLYLCMKLQWGKCIKKNKLFISSHIISVCSVRLLNTLYKTLIKKYNLYLNKHTK